MHMPASLELAVRQVMAAAGAVATLVLQCRVTAIHTETRAAMAVMAQLLVVTAVSEVL